MIKLQKKKGEKKKKKRGRKKMAHQGMVWTSDERQLGCYFYTFSRENNMTYTPKNRKVKNKN